MTFEGVTFTLVCVHHVLVCAAYALIHILKYTDTHEHTH